MIFAAYLQHPELDTIFLGQVEASNIVEATIVARQRFKHVIGCGCLDVRIGGDAPPTQQKRLAVLETSTSFKSQDRARFARKRKKDHEGLDPDSVETVDDLNAALNGGPRKVPDDRTYQQRIQDAIRRYWEEKGSKL